MGLHRTTNNHQVSVQSKAYPYDTWTSIENGELTGEVGDPIVDSDTKINTLREYQSKQAIKDHEIIAVGDGANDIPMLVSAGIGVGYHAFPTAAEAADVAIQHGDLTALLYLQGYSISDFINE